MSNFYTELWIILLDTSEHTFHHILVAMKVVTIRTTSDLSGLILLASNRG